MVVVVIAIPQAPTTVVMMMMMMMVVMVMMIMTNLMVRVPPLRGNSLEEEDTMGAQSSLDRQKER